MWGEKRQNLPPEDEGLTPEKKARFLRDYFDGRTPEPEEEALVKGFLNNPKKFQPTQRARIEAYKHYFPQRSGLNLPFFNRDNRIVDPTNLQDITVSVDYRMNRFRNYEPVCEVSANVKQPDGSYRRQTFGFTAFDLREWVGRVPED